MCFCTWVWRRWSRPPLRSELHRDGGEEERDRFHLQPRLFFQRKANRETCWLTLTGLSWAAICLQGSVHLNAPSLFLHRWLLYCTTVFFSATRSLLFFVFGLFSQFFLTNLNATLLPTITCLTCWGVWSFLMRSFIANPKHVVPVVVVFIIRHQINTEPL